MHLFLDCEFNGWHDQGTGELISLGLVSADGKYEFYEVVDCKNPSPFVVQHVLPILGQSNFFGSFWIPLEFLRNSGNDGSRVGH